MKKNQKNIYIKIKKFNKRFNKKVLIKINKQIKILNQFLSKFKIQICNSNKDKKINNHNNNKKFYNHKYKKFNNNRISKKKFK